MNKHSIYIYHAIKLSHQL